MAKVASVAEYIEGLPEGMREIALRMRVVIGEGLPKAAEVLWHGHPVWTATEQAPGKAPVAMLKAYSSHVTFGLWRGQSIEDPSGRLEAASRGMAHVKIRSAEDIDAELFAGWLARAWELEQAEAAV